MVRVPMTAWEGGEPMKPRPIGVAKNAVSSGLVCYISVSDPGMAWSFVEPNLD